VNSTDTARREVLYAYARWHDRFAEREQVLRHSGMVIHAEGARVYANLVIRAWLAERDDPKPEGLP
jgi:hypothetical protein